MSKHGSHSRLRFVRSAMRQDLLHFVIPAFTIFVSEIRFCAQDGLVGFWGRLWFLLRHPGELLLLSEYFGGEYEAYKVRTKRLIPFMF